MCFGSCDWLVSSEGHRSTIDGEDGNHGEYAPKEDLIVSLTKPSNNHVECLLECVYCRVQCGTCAPFVSS
jgi:hypothetical protein